MGRKAAEQVATRNFAEPLLLRPAGTRPHRLIRGPGRPL